MAFDKTPTTWIANWSEDGTNLSVPIASFPELTAAEADGATGDIRKILFALLEKMWAAWNAKAAGDRPGRMVLSKSSNVNAATGQLTTVYQVSFTVDVTAQEVAAEA
jgi:hypothetical protein